jgi:hypothetical protein
VVRPFSLKVLVSNLAQFGIDEWDQRVQRLLVAAAPTDQQFGDLIRRIPSHG